MSASSRQSAAILLALCLVAAPVSAQQKPVPPPPPPAKPATPATPQKPAPPTTPQKPAVRPAAPQRREITARGFATLGGQLFSAKDSFETVFGDPLGIVYGAGIQVLFPQGFYVESGVSLFRREGERVFVAPDEEVFRLGIPMRVTITPIEISGGWRFVRRPAVARPPLRFGARPSRLVPYVGGGYSWVRYQETADFADEDDEFNEWFSGFHVAGGIEYRVRPTVAVGGEVAWSSIPDALGAGGASAAFGEDNLGGTTFRVKISFGR